MSQAANRNRIDSLSGARQWVWKKLLHRAGKASAESLRRAWYWDPMLLDDALTSLVKDRFLHCVSGTWYIREAQQVQPNLLPDPE